MAQAKLVTKVPSTHPSPIQKPFWGHPKLILRVIQKSILRVVQSYFQKIVWERRQFSLKVAANGATAPSTGLETKARQAKLVIKVPSPHASPIQKPFWVHSKLILRGIQNFF